jgi:hypothetical protein
VVAGCQTDQDRALAGAALSSCDAAFGCPSGEHAVDILSPVWLGSCPGWGWSSPRGAPFRGCRAVGPEGKGGVSLARSGRPSGRACPRCEQTISPCSPAFPPAGSPKRCRGPGQRPGLPQARGVGVVSRWTGLVRGHRRGVSADRRAGQTMGGNAELGVSAGRAESGAVMLNRQKPSSTPARQHRSPGLTCFELASHALSRSARRARCLGSYAQGQSAAGFVG